MFGRISTELGFEMNLREMTDAQAKLFDLQAQVVVKLLG